MNKSIEQYFNTIESMFVDSPYIASYEVIQRLVGPTDGKLRNKALITNKGLAEFFEYVVADPLPQAVKYSYHLQNSDGTLWKRWDNAPHFPKLPNAPHHYHLGIDKVMPVEKQIDIETVLLELEQEMT